MSPSPGRAALAPWCLSCAVVKGSDCVVMLSLFLEWLLKATCVVNRSVVQVLQPLPFPRLTKSRASNSQNLLGFQEEDVAQQTLSEPPLVKGLVFLSPCQRTGDCHALTGREESFSCCAFFGGVKLPLSHAKARALHAWPCCTSLRRSSGWGHMLLHLCDPWLPAG